MIEALCYCLISLSAGILGTVILLKSRSNWFNGKVCKKSTDGTIIHSEVEFEVKSATLTYDQDGHRVCKYELEASFFNRKDCADWICNKFIMYGEVGKYNIGDTLKLVKE